MYGLSAKKMAVVESSRWPFVEVRLQEMDSKVCHASGIPPSTALYRAGERWAGPVSQPPRSLTRLCNSRSLLDPARTPVMDPKWNRELEGKWNWINSGRNEEFLRNGFQMAWLNFGCRDLWVLLKTIVTSHSRFALASTARLGKRSAWGGSWGYFITECRFQTNSVYSPVYRRSHPHKEFRFPSPTQPIFGNENWKSPQNSKNFSYSKYKSGMSLTYF